MRHVPATAARPASAWLVAAVLAAAVTATVAGCGGGQKSAAGSGSGPTATASSATAAGSSAGGAGTGDVPAACLDEGAISAAVGFTVVLERSTLKQSADAVNCTFPAADKARLPGAYVSILVAPASFADRMLSGITTNAQNMRTTAGPVDVGERGLAYGSPDRSEAGAVVGSRIVVVTVGTSGLSVVGGKRDAAVTLLRQVVAKVG
jgi:hypothetical protein